MVETFVNDGVRNRLMAGYRTKPNNNINIRKNIGIEMAQYLDGKYVMPVISIRYLGMNAHK
ncbi:hypothetical protein DERP_009195 [Dermatophagoides pteronyssinus]|uniref:Uncharacterized protein n=1 Tax=Dermatophagoides pteronyssinus TaxID=6956 RepID=A0ABQ8JQT2_DERPT|nr:hypothetical protein DERP_009195 [Dermatophagoides pteronyssinus]